MNWETYKTLTPELKEEYNWRFKDKGKFESKGLLNNCTSFMFVVTIFIFTIFIIITNPEFESYKIEIIDMFTATVKIILITLIVVIIHLILIVFNMIYVYYLKYKWIRKNNIKRQGQWWKI